MTKMKMFVALGLPIEVLRGSALIVVTVTRQFARGPARWAARGRALLLAASMVGVANASAQTTYTCQGVPVGVSMDATGTLTVQYIGGLSWAYLCGVNDTENGIAPVACKSLYALLLMARSSGRPVTLWFTNAAGSCGANSPWSFASNLYFWRIDQ